MPLILIIIYCLQKILLANAYINPQTSFVGFTQHYPQQSRSEQDKKV
jgi:hypothetical protein